jgi:uncharacterized protein with FMN-binding domain
MHDRPPEPSRLPIRGTIGLAGTIGAIALLLSFRGAPSLTPEATVAGEATGAPATEELTARAALETFARTAEAAPGLASAAPLDEPATTEPTQAPATAEPTDTPANEAVRTATGDAIAIRWGDVQVAVTVQGDDIVAVETLAIPTGDRRSDRINGYAEPILREEAIATDNADVSVVSGATYTSEAYATSLQSALDRLGA